MELGEYVIDTEDNEPDLAVVVHQPATPIDEIVIQGDGKERTVAEDNPEYDADTPAVVVAFVESGLNRYWPEWRERSAEDLYEGVQDHDITLYTFPESRLSTVTEEDAAAFLAEPVIDLEALRARLEDAEWETKAVDGGGVVAEKMGEQYRIYPTGAIDGDGRLRTPLKNLVSQYRTSPEEKDISEG